MAKRSLSMGTHININNNIITTNNYLKYLSPLAANKKTNMTASSLGYATSKEVKPIDEVEPLDSRRVAENSREALA